MYILLKKTIVIAVMLFLTGLHTSIAQPGGYPALSAVKKGAPNPYSPDPIFNYVWANPKASDGLESYTLKPVKFSASPAKSFGMKNYKQDSIITVEGTGNLRFDFGQNNAGWLEFESPDMDGTIEMSVSEFDEQPVYVKNYPTKTMVPKKYGNTYRLELNKELYEGVQYGWIRVRAFNKPWHIKNLRLICQIHPVNYRGSFNCSDPMLTRIWYTGAYTVKLNLLKDYLGAILMNRGDRFSWTGDAHPSQAASMAAFGNYDFVKQNIAYTSTQSNGIKSYALYWVLSLIDYYYYTDDTATLNQYLANASGKLDEAYKEFGTNPNLEFYGWDERLGAGFEHPNLPEPQNAYKMLSIRAWKEFGEAMGKFGNAALRDKYLGYASEKIALLKKDKGWYRSFGLHAGADAITTGLLNAEEKKAIYSKSFTDRINRISYSPFNQYFVIQAFARMNRYNEAFGSIDDLWGGQIRYGGTTFFEDYRTSWNDAIHRNGPVPVNQCGVTSLCHPWGAGVTKWLSEEVLGIKPTSPGFATYDILPHLGSKLNSVSGSTPLLRGNISASFNLATGQCAVSSPEGTIARVGLPKAGRTISRIVVNGALVWDGKLQPQSEIGGATEDADFIYLSGVKPGNYKINVAYSGKAPSYAELPGKYAARFVGIDTTTTGNWGGKYGTDGYVLCNYEGNGQDRQVLPAYVAGIEYYKVKGNGKPLNAIWEQTTNNKRALAPDKSNGFPRTAACLYAQDGDQIGYTFTSTISLKKAHPYKVSLYFVDWDKKGRKMAVEMFDAETNNLIAPVKIIENSEGGAYITYSYNKSVKFRINIQRGDNPVLSGIFFGPLVSAMR